MTFLPFIDQYHQFAFACYGNLKNENDRREFVGFFYIQESDYNELVVFSLYSGERL